jgi:hypothetical protein
MTTYTHKHGSETDVARGGAAPSVAPSAFDVVFGLANAVAGAGIMFMSFLAPIPGLVAALILAGVLMAPLLIPVVVGAVAWLAFVLLRLAARLTLRVVAHFFAYAAPSGRRSHGPYGARISAYPARGRWP